ncbi:20701_t:CDS:2 [Entrophospora sp. SA101]|nr:20701_t:CDS:2 [Entrophospora sp. SA101]
MFSRVVSIHLTIADSDTALQEINENEILVEPKFTKEEIENLLKEAEESKHIGNEHFFKGNFEEAIRYYQKSVDTCPVELGEQRAIYWGNLSACYFKLQNYNDSVEMCTKALEVSPDYTKVLFHYEALNKNSIHHTKLTSQNHKQIQTSIRNLPARIEESKEKEKAEMIKNHPELQLAPPFAGNSQSRRYKRCQISNAITKDKFLIERILQIRGALQRISEKEYCTRKGIVVTESDHSTPRRNHKNSRL